MKNIYCVLYETNLLNLFLYIVRFINKNVWTQVPSFIICNVKHSIKYARIIFLTYLKFKSITQKV